MTPGDKSVVDDATEFDPRVPVGEGVTLLEASAGTGKTHAVASLVVVEVAQGRPLDQLLVVTFTRKATATLRQRVWQRLTDTARELHPDATGTSDDVVAYLRSGSSENVALRRENLERALSEFDAATIATTHGFCQQVLTSLGMAGDCEAAVPLVDSIDDLIEAAVDDLFVRRLHAGEEVLFDRTSALKIAKAVVQHPECVIAPVDLRPDDILRFRFATTVRRRIDEQKRRGRVITYDDLLTRLDATMSQANLGDIAAGRLRRRFTMAVVDEFQDTDPMQWRILRKAFGDAPARLVLVGDPKQAVYSFRGGDVATYIQASKDAHHRRRLTVSWRADQPLLDSLDRFFRTTQLGGPAIRVHPMKTAPANDRMQLRTAEIAPSGARPSLIEDCTRTAPLRVRIASRDSGQFLLTRTNPKYAAKASAQAFVAQDLAAEAIEIVQRGSRFAPGDIAVLVRTNREADVVAEALRRSGLPAVIHGGPSVYDTEAAKDWLDLLRAFEQPASTPRVHAVARGPFVGWNAALLATATDPQWEEVDAALHEWAAVLRTHSVPGLLRRVEATMNLAARLLATVGGERRFNDLRHLAELLHHRQSSHPGSVGALARWLSEQMTTADQARTEGDRRRLESDSDAVAVYTIHAAKGLEFPVVLLPSLWFPGYIDPEAPPIFSDAEGRRTIGVGQGPARRHQMERAAIAGAAEELRLLYVALTRARHLVVAWWATGYDSDKSAFARVLCGQDDDGAVVTQLRSKPSEAEIAAALDAHQIPWSWATGATEERFKPDEAKVPDLGVADFDRRFDTSWVRTSYSGLTRAAHEAAAQRDFARLGIGVSEPVEVDETAKTDEIEDASPSADFRALSSVPDPTLSRNETLVPGNEPVALSALPGGARVGTLIHDMLERCDFTTVNLSEALADAAIEAGADRIIEGQTPALIHGLQLAIETPLGAPWDGRRLRDLSPTDRLDELAFDIALAGGDHPTSALVTMDAIADVFATLPAEGPLGDYHRRLRDPAMATQVRGFLTGSIDLVARVGERHMVVDYKSNRLGQPGETLTAWHYRPEALEAAMADAHYPLQASLYQVALHRFLRWRLREYRPARHLGAISYLFLRGMTGADGSAGVFSWSPPVDFVLGLSDALDRGSP